MNPEKRSSKVSYMTKLLIDREIMRLVAHITYVKIVNFFFVIRGLWIMFENKIVKRFDKSILRIRDNINSLIL